MPIGPLSGKRTWWRRAFSLGTASANRLLDLLPISRWIHRMVQRDLEIHEVEIELERGHEGLQGLRIALLTDIHAGSFMNQQDLCDIFARVAAEKPDVVCISGDLINTFEREILLLREPLALLDPPHGIFAVPGNHDHFYGRDIGLWESFLRDQGVTVQINAGQRIEHNGGSIWMAGVDDLTEGDPDVGPAMEGRRDGEPAILLSHHPDFFFEAAANDIDLTLSGHTHGGQIMICGKTPLKHSAFGYWAGRYEQCDAQLYVSRGIGVTFLPVRIGARPEIPILRLKVPAARVDEATTAVEREQPVSVT